MTRTITLLASVPLLAFVPACGESPQPTAPAPAVETAADGPSLTQLSPGRQILMLDQCDPESFNAALDDPEACTNRRGGMPFATFIAQLEKHQRVDSWRFSPAVINVAREVTLPIVNMGGEVHSFTEVEEFGGGFVEELNVLSGNPDPAPECVHPEIPGAPHPGVTLVAPGGHDTHTFHPGDADKYQCCIHPWMRAVSR